MSDTVNSYKESPYYKDPTWRLDAQILHKFDWKSEWEKIHNNFIPAAGEVIIYAFPSATNGPNGPSVASVAFKIGDGTHKLSELKFCTNSVEETWTFTFSDGSSTTKNMMLASDNNTQVGNVYI